MPPITDRFLERLVLPEGKPQLRIWDTTIKGFGAVRGAESTSLVMKTYPNGKAQQEVLGKWGEEFRVADGRRLALEILGRVASGKMTPLQEARLAETGPTLREAIKSYLEDIKKGGARPGSLTKIEEEMTGKWLADWLDRPFRSIHAEEWQARHTAIGTPHRATANRIFICLGTIWKFLAKQYLLKRQEWPTCPNIVVKLYPKVARRNTLGMSQLKGWAVKVLALKNLQQRVFNLFTLFTGLRLFDAFTLRWEHLNLTSEPLMVRVWSRARNTFEEWELPPFSMVRPSPKGGESCAFVVPLPTFVVELLKAKLALRTEATDNGWVLWGVRTKTRACWQCEDLGIFGGHVAGAVTHMCDARAYEAGLPNAHRLRATVATASQLIGMPDNICQALMNHKLVGTTMTDKYRRPPHELLAEWSQKLCDYLMDRTGLQPNARAYLSAEAA